jgi:hypothetical protein
MRKPLWKFAIGAALLFGAGGPAMASGTNAYGKITGVYGTYNGAVLFSVNVTTRDTPPACAANLPNRWAIDASTVAGQAAVQVLYWAIEHHKLVWVTGTGSCSIWSDTETVALFSIHDTDY